MGYAASRVSERDTRPASSPASAPVSGAGNAGQICKMFDTNRPLYSADRKPITSRTTSVHIPNLKISPRCILRHLRSRPFCGRCARNCCAALQLGRTVAPMKACGSVRVTIRSLRRHTSLFGTVMSRSMTRSTWTLWS